MYVIFLLFCDGINVFFQEIDAVINYLNSKQDDEKITFNDGFADLIKCTCPTCIAGFLAIATDE